MLLAIDLGNTEIKAGRWDGRRWTRVARAPKPGSRREAEEFLSQFDSEPIRSSICASVMPDLEGPIKDAGMKCFEVSTKFLNVDMDLGIEIRYRTPQTLGADRLANALAVASMSTRNGVAVDVGTATKLEAVSSGVYLGGAIMPGLQMMAKALSTGTALLPEVDLTAPERAIGIDTSTAVRSGVLHGHASAVDGMIERFAREMGPKPEVFITGGLAETVAPLCRTAMRHVPTLTLDGLVVAAKRLGLA